MQLSDLTRKFCNENILFSVLLELTYRCNLDCTFCYNDRSLKGTPFRFEHYKKLMEDLLQMGTLNISLSGGEPLAHPDFFRIGALAREMGFVTRVKTNGHALRSRLLERLKKEVDPYNLDLSLHGASAAVHDRQTQVPGSFERLMQNCAEMKAIGMRFRFNMPMTRWNENEISEVFDIVDLFETSINIDPVITSRDNGDKAPLSLSSSEAGMMKLSDLMGKRRKAQALKYGVSENTGNDIVIPQKKHCGSGSSTVTVDPYGNVYPCVQLRRAAGNLHKQSIRQIWEGSEVLDEVRELTVRVKEWTAEQGESCQKIGFCPGTALHETGSATKLYPQAEMRVTILDKKSVREEV